MSKVATAKKICIHCGSFIPTQWEDTEYCCSGCQYVYRMIHEYNLDDYYKLKPTRNQPLIGLFLRKETLDWVDQETGFTTGKMLLQIEGIQCSACVWLVRELSTKIGVAKVSVNTSIGTILIEFTPGKFDVKKYLELIQEFGYRTSPFRRKSVARANKGLLIRFGLCAALAMNSMMVSASFYVGLNKNNDKNIFQMFSNLNFIFATLAVLIGGSYFISRSVQALKKGILHFDLPIAVGLTLAYTGSVYVHFTGLEDKAYFDTVCIFISLMLLGRFLQNRMIEKNKNQILADEQITELKIKKIGKTIESITFAEIKMNDRLLVSQGTIIPVEAELLSRDEIECSLSWINGESEPIRYKEHDPIPSGAQLISNQAVEIRALTDFSFSSLAMLVPNIQADEMMPKLWTWITKYYVMAVLFIVTTAFFIWSFIDIQKAFEVAVGLSVVTCPCGLGIAIPLARSLANKKIMSMGVFARDPYLLEKLQSVQKVFFDKTGTLTLSNLTVVNSAELTQLDNHSKTVLFNAVARSNHPASRAIYQYLLGKKIQTTQVHVREIVGQGLDIESSGKRYFLGKKKGVQTSDAGYEVVFESLGQTILNIHLEETVLDGARETVDFLQKQHIQVFQLSGDKPNRVESMAARLGIDSGHSFAECTPEKKAKLIQKEDHANTLYLGDGLNDTLAFQKAFLSGSPLTEHSSLIQQSHFFFISPSLEFLKTLFLSSQKLKKTIRFNLGFAVIYNIAVVAIGLAGWISPLFCAIIMPLSSLFVVGSTSLKLKKLI